MKKLGIVLIVLEVLAIISGFITGKSVFLKLMYSNEPGAALIAEVIGFLLPGIIGIILISKANKREKEAGTVDSGASVTASSTGTAYASGSGRTSASSFCPKCGCKVDDDDVFCVNCGTKLMR